MLRIQHPQKAQPKRGKVSFQIRGGPLQVAAKPRPAIIGEKPIPNLPRKPVLEEKQLVNQQGSVGRQIQNVPNASRDPSISQPTTTATQQTSVASSPNVFPSTRGPPNLLPKPHPEGRPSNKTSLLLLKGPPGGNASVKPTPLHKSAPAHVPSDVIDDKNVPQSDCDKATVNVQTVMKINHDDQITRTIKEKNENAVKSSTVQSIFASSSSASCKLTLPTPNHRTSPPTLSVRPKPTAARRNIENSVSENSNSGIPKTVQQQSESVCSSETAIPVSNTICNQQTHDLDSSSGDVLLQLSLETHGKIENEDEIKSLLVKSCNTHSSVGPRKPLPKVRVQKGVALDSSKCYNKSNHSNSELDLKDREDKLCHKNVQLHNIEQGGSQNVPPYTRERHKVSTQANPHFAKADEELSSAKSLGTQPKPIPRKLGPLSQPKPAPRQTVSQTRLCKTDQALKMQSKSNEHIPMESGIGATTILMRAKSEDNINSYTHEFNYMTLSTDNDSSVIEKHSSNRTECDVESSAQTPCNKYEPCLISNSPLKSAIRQPGVEGKDDNKTSGENIVKTQENINETNVGNDGKCMMLERKDTSSLSGEITDMPISRPAVSDVKRTANGIELDSPTIDGHVVSDAQCTHNYTTSSNHTEDDSCDSNAKVSTKADKLADEQLLSAKSNDMPILEAALPCRPKQDNDTFIVPGSVQSDSHGTEPEIAALINSSISQSLEASSISSTGCTIDNALKGMSISDSKVNISPSQDVSRKDEDGVLHSFEPMSSIERSDVLKNEAVCGIRILSGDGSRSPAIERVSSSESDEESEEKIKRKKDKKLFMIAREVASSEKVFVDVLVLLNVDFRKHIAMTTEENGSLVIPSAVLNGMLTHLPPLQTFSEGLLNDLDDRVRNWEQHPRLADVFVKQGRFLLLYSTYIRDFEKMTSNLDEATKKYPAFAAALKDFEKSPRCASLALKHYMLKPIQRIPQYKLLLTDYMKHLTPDSEEMKDSQTALENVSEVAQHANEAFRQAEDAEKMLAIQRSLSGQFEVMKPGRVFLKKGELMKLSRKEPQPRFFFLFSDVLLYTTQVAMTYRIGHILPLAGMKVKETDHDDYKTEFSIMADKKAFTLRGATLDERDDWVSALNSAIRENVQKRSTFDSVRLGEQEATDKDFKISEKPPIWVPDGRVSMCMLCMCNFTLTRRRHHCRACGKIVCGACSEKTAPLKYMRYKEARVCDDCYKVLVTDFVDGKVNDKKPTRRERFFGMFKVAADEEGVCISGYLSRLEKTKKWKKLWFIIKDNALFWFKASKDRKPEASMALLGYQVTRPTDEIEDVDPSLLFQLSHPNLEPVVFRADSAKATERWMTKMREASAL